jgi:uncharacterized membrane protein SpoIIM required for sporulation
MVRSHLQVRSFQRLQESSSVMIKTILSLIIVLIIAVFSYWMYVAYSGSSTSPYWAEINAKMPDPLRRYACEELRKREAGTVASCENQ